MIGPAVCIKVLGCRVNIYEADALASAFQAAGATIVCKSPWDVAVLVSCAVTAEADRKSRQAVRRFRRTEPNCIVVATGCWAQGLSDEEARSLGIDLVVGNRRKGELVPSVLRMIQGEAVPSVRCDVCASSEWDPLVIIDRPRLKTRAFLKVQDGCDHFCTYCIIPSVRGKPVSRSGEDVLQEVRSVVDSGCSEVVLTGVHLGLYGRGTDETLATLLLNVASVPGVSRIRLGSLEPFSVGDDLLRVMAETPQFCRHLHLPLQSGDDDVLRAMGRGHTRDQYLRLLERIRRVLGDDIHISTDVMVGFPGEDSQAYESTLSVLRDGALGRIHGFPYSPRSGTIASTMSNRPSRALAEQRCRGVLDLGDTLLDRYARRWLGRTVDVLVEERLEGAASGYTPQFLRCRAEGDCREGAFLRCRVERVDHGELRGQVVV